MTVPISDAHDYFLNLQSRIVQALEDAGNAHFERESWTREEGGGLSRYLEGGELFERAGVLFSHVKGKTLPPSASAHRKELAGRSWEAMGVSMVLHPRNPYIPTTHMNVRLFVAHAPADTREEDVFWFGGGLDLTPYYPFEDDARHFHQVCHDAVAPFGADRYAAYKRWCDEYFYLKHRGETRGIGGLFFDDLNQDGFAESFALTQSVGNALLPAYMPIVEKRRTRAYGERERAFQAYRRGRYVEFNLVYDRGTLFGLQSGGRTESILLSMPPSAAWRYCYTPETGSPEAELASYLRPRDWL